MDNEELPFEEEHPAEDDLPAPDIGDFEIPQLEPDPPAETKEFKDTTIWKKWSVSGGMKRFISIRPWMEAAKVAVDIGVAGESAEGKALKSNTIVWADLLALQAYLHAISIGRGEVIYPASDREGIPTPEGFAKYGGGSVEGNAVSRILKVHHWGTKEKGYDSSAFVWKCGHFVARISKTGAYIPDMSKCLSFDSIKVSRREMHELGTVLGLALAHHAARTEEQQWLEEISGRRKG